MSKKDATRRRFTVTQKATILRRHLADKMLVSDLCDEYKLQPSVYYTWQNQAFENLEASLEKGPGSRRAATKNDAAKEVDQLKARIAQKNEVIAEVAAEMVALKKELGEL